MSQVAYWAPGLGLLGALLFPTGLTLSIAVRSVLSVSETDTKERTMNATFRAIAKADDARDTAEAARRRAKSPRVRADKQKILNEARSRYVDLIAPLTTEEYDAYLAWRATGETA